MTNTLSKIFLILLVAYGFVCMWSYGQKTMEASLQGEVLGSQEYGK